MLGPVGSWKLVLDGFEGTLALGDLSSDGTIQGTLVPGAGMAEFTIFDGLWDDAAQKLSFVTCEVDMSQGLPTAMTEVAALTRGRTRQFVGYLMQSPPNPGAGQDVVLTLAGSYEAGPHVGGNRRRSCFGWYATRDEQR